VAKSNAKDGNDTGETMKVKELIALLQTVNPDGQVFHGYDGNIVLTEPGEVLQVNQEDIDGENCWFRVKAGDVVILEA